MFRMIGRRSYFRRPIARKLSNGNQDFCANELLDRLSESERKQILMEILKRDDLERIFREADENHDGMVSPLELSKWYSRRFIAKKDSSDDEDLNKDVSCDDEVIERKQLARLAVQFSIPMIGFGFADNFIMICAGEFIDAKIGAALAISTMAAAGLGNLVSDVAGVGLSSIIERTADTMGLPKPNLTKNQKASRIVKLTTAASSASGIAVGCLFGMAPLYFI